jgi:hypothetical protein
LYEKRAEVHPQAAALAHFSRQGVEQKDGDVHVALPGADELMRASKVREFMLSSHRIAIAVAPLVLVVALGASVAAAPRLTPPPWQRQSTVPAGETVGGISCDAQEGQRIHIHQHLVILDHGKAVNIPPNVGQPAGKRCIYWLHTHTPDGIIHIEAPKDRSFTLGDFFMVWGQPLNRTTVDGARAANRGSLRVWVNGKRYKGDPRSIPLVAHADIVIQVGSPFVKPPTFTTWGPL